MLKQDNFFKKCNFSIITIGSEMKLDIPVHYHYQHYNIIHLNISIFVFHVIIHINRLRSTLSTSVLSFKLIVIEKF
jgi:hypothetical protein